MVLIELLSEKISSSDLPPILAFINERVKAHSFKKGELVQQAGVPCHHLYFINKGLARAFYLKEGKDISCYFASEGMFVTAINSFLREEISQFDVELIEDSELISLSFEDIKKVLEEFPAMETFFRELLSDAYCNLVERVNLLQFYSAREKYDNFVTKFPHLFQRLPLGHIASYLGMTQETLSRARNSH